MSSSPSQPASEAQPQPDAPPVVPAQPLPDTAYPPGEVRLLPLDQFGQQFLRLILHKDRVVQIVADVLGPTFTLGPIGAGPGRKVARVTARGTYGTPTGVDIDEGWGYDVMLPLHVLFDLDLRVRTMTFEADVLVPLRLRMDVARPLTIRWHIHTPHAEEIQLELTSASRGSTVLNKVVGLEDELRRFIVRFVERELAKPYVHKATHLDVVSLIDNAWDQIAAQFLPASDAERQVPHLDELEPPAPDANRRF